MKKLALILALALLICVLSIGALASGADVSLQSVAQAQLPGEGILLSVEMDDGAAEYKFYVAATQETYEIKLDPATGAVLAKESDRWDDRGGDTVTLNEEAVRAIVLGEYPDAVISAVTIIQDDGLYEYKVSFTVQAMAAVYSIHPVSGVVLEREITFNTSSVSILPAGGEGGATSPAGSAASGGTTSGGTTTASLTAEQAKALVLARLTNGTITQFKADTDDGRAVYEGEARDATHEYDFEIDRATGRFLEWESERYAVAQKTAQPATGATSAASDSLIGTSKAKEIALGKAGGGSVASIRLTRDDGRQVYEGKVRTSTYEYEFEIDASSGRVLDWDADRIERDDRDDDDDDHDDDDDDDDDHDDDDD